ncbi:hypothetical protein [Streptomyces sp. NRRL B-1140]|uniref:hypothetical protein n=1 Tax=Streptomyces sp. NRRL B-1140 TaxID=1415549 RepID=UPI001F3D292A|nr:hypothetical protein [Streptomyces sp. NRRL B-1140]
MGGLDDAIRASRSKANMWENSERQREERERKERAEAQQLLAEAAVRLRPFGSETFVRVKPVMMFGDYTGPDGQRYRRVSQQRCWRIVRISGRREVDGELSNVWMDSPILLLEDGSAGRFWLDPELRPAREGEYVSSTDPDPLSKRSFIDPRGGFVDELKRYLADAIVRYERGDR